jgi:CRISPR-associated protein Cmr3
MSRHWRPFRVTPEDVLFFRDGRPSSRGADHFLPSLFPPHPSTLYGALRTRRLIDEDVSLEELRREKQDLWSTLAEELRAELGPWGGFGALELRGPWLVHDGQVLLPAPADLGVRVAQNAAGADGDPPRVEEVVRFLLLDEPSGGHSHPLGLLAPHQRTGGGWVPWPADAARAPEPVAGWFLRPRGLARWAEGALPEPDDFVHASELWAPEPRVGLGMESRRRAGETGMLYTFGFVRLQPGVALGFEVRNSALEPDRRIRLGGEGRTAWLDDGTALPPATAPASKRIRLAFATPGPSEGGAWPPGFSPDALSGRVGGADLRLVAASVPGYQAVGGWDLARNRAKPLRRAIPAGAVFVFESTDGRPVDPADLHGINLSGYEDEHLARQGFGLVLAGVDPQET